MKFAREKNEAVELIVAAIEAKSCKQMWLKAASKIKFMKLRKECKIKCNLSSMETRSRNGT